MMMSFLHSFLILSLIFWPMNQEKKEEVKKSQLELPANLAPFDFVRILIKKNTPKVTIESKSAYQVYDGKGQFLFEGNQILSTPMEISQQGVRLGRQVFQETPITIVASEGDIKVDDRLYRESITVWPFKNKELMVVNELLLEDYLRGVLPWEIDPKWHPEALKAQAVASRTYALFNAIERQDSAYDMVSTVYSQVYKGKSIEKPQTDIAIKETKGQILTYRGKIFPTYFHSNSGGATTQADYVWNIESHPSLMGVRSEVSAYGKNFYWKSEFKISEMVESLKKNGAPITSMDEFSIGKVDSFGRAMSFVIRSGKKKFKFQANKLRLWMDPAKFKSTFIKSIRKRGDTFIIQGYGWGHGVGMCQYGMKRLAELGYTYREILDYYYPGSQLKQI